jgi:hypothetical protein
MPVGEDSRTERENVSLSVRYAHRRNCAVPNVTGHFRPKRTVSGAVARSWAADALSYSGARAEPLCPSPDQHDGDLANKAPRLDRLSVSLRTSLAKRSGCAGGQGV